MKQAHRPPFAALALGALLASCGRVGYDALDSPPAVHSDRADGSPRDATVADVTGDRATSATDGPSVDVTGDRGVATIDAPTDDVTGDRGVLASGESSASDAADDNARDAPAESAPSPRSLYLEAESGALSGGFTVGADPKASAGSYLAPPVGVMSEAQPGPAEALYSFTLASAGTYVVWGRIHSPDAIHNRFWVRVDLGTWYLWRISTGDVWYWDAVHDDTQYDTPLTFALGAGTHRISIANCVDGLGLDRLYVTADGDKPPGNSTLCNPPHSIEINGSCSPSCGSQQGNLCGVQQCAGYPVLQAYDCDVCCVHP